MRRVLGSALRKEFDRQMKDNVPQFEFLPGDQFYPGDRLYCWRVRSDLSFYIRLVIDPKGQKDEFIVEIGWSRTGQQPTKFVWGPEEGLDEDMGYFRIYNFWTRNSRWWSLWDRDFGEKLLEDYRKPGESDLEVLKRVADDEGYKQRLFDCMMYEEPVENILPKIPGFVEEAISKIQQYALPFFNDFLARRISKKENAE